MRCVIRINKPTVIILLVFATHSSLSRATFECAELFKNHQEHQKTLRVVEVKDQCNTRLCSTFTALSAVELEILKQSGKVVPLNPEYSVLSTLRTRARRAILGEDHLLISEDSDIVERVAEIFANGVMPKSSGWQAAVPISDWLDTQTPYEEIQNLTWGLNAPKLSADPELRTKMLEQIDDVIEKYAGKLPETFTVNDGTYTPQKFLADMVGTSNVSVEILQPEEENYGNAVTKHGRHYIMRNIEKYGAKLSKAEMPSFELKIQSSINSGQSVPLTIIWVPSLIDGDSQAFLPPTFDPRRRSGPIGNHLVLLTGFEVNQKTKETTYHIQNSWGVNAGKSGHYRITGAYLRMFAIDIALIHYLRDEHDSK